MAVLKHAWRLYAAFDAGAKSLQGLFRRLQAGIIGLGIAVTTFAVLYTEVSGTWQEVSRWATIVVPSLVAFLIAWAARRAFGKRWVLLRAAAEAVRSETFRYRTSTGVYCRPPEGAVHNREDVLRQRLELIAGQLSTTEVGSAPLPSVTRPGLPGRVVTEDLRDLTPMGYLQRRVEDQCAYYGATVRKKNLRRNVLQFVTLAMGGTGTILAAVSFERWVAISAAVGTGAATYLATRQHEEDVVVYNAAAAELDAVRLEWLAAGRDRAGLEDLVTRTEEILTEEVGAWARRMARVLDEQAREAKAKT